MPTTGGLHKWQWAWGNESSCCCTPPSEEEEEKVWAGLQPSVLRAEAGASRGRNVSVQDSRGASFSGRQGGRGRAWSLVVFVAADALQEPQGHPREQQRSTDARRAPSSAAASLLLLQRSSKLLPLDLHLVAFSSGPAPPRPPAPQSRRARSRSGCGASLVCNRSGDASQAGARDRGHGKARASGQGKHGKWAGARRRERRVEFLVMGGLLEHEAVRDVEHLLVLDAGTDLLEPVDWDALNALADSDSTVPGVQPVIGAAYAASHAAGSRGIRRVSPLHQNRALYLRALQFLTAAGTGREDSSQSPNSAAPSCACSMRTRCAARGGEHECEEQEAGPQEQVRQGCTGSSESQGEDEGKERAHEHQAPADEASEAADEAWCEGEALSRNVYCAEGDEGLHQACRGGVWNRALHLATAFYFRRGVFDNPCFRDFVKAIDVEDGLSSGLWTVPSVRAHTISHAFPCCVSHACLCCTWRWTLSVAHAALILQAEGILTLWALWLVPQRRWQDVSAGLRFSETSSAPPYDEIAAHFPLNKVAWPVCVSLHELG
jgi:hypothetical protein